jgi:hypothetical protein
MKIETGAAHLFNSQPTQANTAKNANQSSSFAAIMAEKLQQTTASSTTAAKTTETSGAGKYDFTNISRNELLETVNGLIGSGHLTLDDTSSLLGMMGSSPLQKVNYDGKPLEGGDIPMNVFARIQEGIEGARSRNETSSIAGLQRAAEALAQFQKPSFSAQA